MRSFVFGVAGALAGLVILGDTPARACGGCFTMGQTQNPTVVTDHRMILSVSLDQTTLYDQIQYSGSPESFAWVLPIAGTATVGLSSDLVFQTLDSLTQTVVYAPPTGCPPPPNCPYKGGADASAAFGDAGAPVNVLKQETVGPYETVQLQSTDPQALDAWLTSHGYAIPADIEPVIQAYVADGLDFLAMKLVPGANVQSMRPVRVTTQGASPVLPLRMVAAGTGQNVGITLWVISEGRYEPQNFPWFRIDDSELVWNWSSQSSNYTALRAQKEQASNGTAWEMESSLPLDVQQFKNTVDNGGYPYPIYGYDAGADYDPTAAPDGGDAGGESSSQVRDDDLATLFEGMSPANVRVTRMRSDLARAALGQDLALQASADQSVLTNKRYPTKTSGSPVCPSYGSCPSDNVASYGGGCALAGQKDEGGTLLAFVAMLGMAGFGLARRRKR